MVFPRSLAVHRLIPRRYLLNSGRLFASDNRGDGDKTPISTPFGDKKVPEQPTKPQGLFSRILSGPLDGGGQQAQHQSHSKLLAVGDVIYELQTHDTIGGQKDKYLKSYKRYADEVSAAVPGAELFGSWAVIYGNQDQMVNLWRYPNGFADIDKHIQALQQKSSVKTAELEYAAVCGRRRTVVTKPFSYWGEPKPREPSHVYDLRSYVLKPGSMIEWGNAWSKGITYRREYNQDVGGFFSQIGQLYMVFHIWAYESMVSRNTTRQHTWSKPGWDTTVSYTVPLITRMQSRILVPTELSKLK